LQEAWLSYYLQRCGLPHQKHILLSHLRHASIWKRPSVVNSSSKNKSCKL
jgi:hypothetical protein